MKKTILTPDRAMEIVLRQRQTNRESAKRFRQRMIKENYYYIQTWVPDEVKDEVKAFLTRIVKKAEAARENRPPKR